MKVREVSIDFFYKINKYLYRQLRRTQMVHDDSFIEAMKNTNLKNIVYYVYGSLYVVYELLAIYYSIFA